MTGGHGRHPDLDRSACIAAPFPGIGSTNGSKLNGANVAKAPLEPESVIEIGHTRMVFRVLAHAADEPASTGTGRAG